MGQGHAATAVALFVAMIAVLLMGAPTRSASATQGTLRIDSGTAFAGEEVSVGVHANVGEPGLGAWTVDVTYDSTVISAVSCAGPSAYTVCSTTLGPDTVLATGAHPTGLVGDITLATFTFRCERAGTSQLSISTRVFADATTDAPQDINETVQNGALTCVERLTHYGTLEIGSATAEVSETTKVQVEAEHEASVLGAGAWTFDIDYDSDVVSVQECLAGRLPRGDPGQTSCDGEFALGAVRVTGASAGGLQASQVLATIAFKCERAGRSELTAQIHLWAYATIAIPQEPRLPEVSPGSITCVGPDTPAPTATPAPAALPPAGGGPSGSSPPLWPIAAIAAFGVGMAAAGAVAARRRA